MTKSREPFIFSAGLLLQTAFKGGAPWESGEKSADILLLYSEGARVPG